LRYIGSKILLIPEIEKVINSNVLSANSFTDLFSGTASVGRYFKTKFRITSNDLLYFSYVLQKATIQNNILPKFNFKLSELFNQDSSVNYEKFIFNNYSPNQNSERQYFSNENALKIDIARQNIEYLREKIKFQKMNIFIF